MEGKKRVRPFGLVAAIVVLAALAAAVVAALNRGPYAFLERFHPKHVPIDLGRLMPGGYTPAPGAPPLPKMTMLVFDDSQAEGVLAEMRRQLTPERGYEIHSNPASSGAKVKDDPLGGDTMCVFIKTRSVSASLVGMEEGAIYQSGRLATVELATYDGDPGPTSGLFGNPRALEKLKPSCIVMISHEPTWLERQTDRVKKFLHLG